MGCKCSKNWEQSTRRRRSEEGNAGLELESGDLEATPDPGLSSYEAACRADPQLRTLDAIIQRRSGRTINSIPVDLDAGDFSLDFLRYVAECLLERNQDLVSIILQSKKDIWKNPELSDVVDEYSKNSIQSLELCAAIDACLKRALNSQYRINQALKKFEEEHAKAEGSSNLYSKTLEELRNFKDAGQPFTEELFSLFQAVCNQQMSILVKLPIQKKKLNRKIGRLKTWRNVTNVIFLAAFVSVWICSVVAAAVTAPALVTALTAAAAAPLGLMGKWLNSFWTKCEEELKGQREIIFSIQMVSYMVNNELDSIRVLAEKVQIQIGTLMQNAEFAMTEDEAVAIGVIEMKKKIDGFTKAIQDLSNHADKCGQNINSMRTMILKIIINPHPTSSSSSGNYLFGSFFS